MTFAELKPLVIEILNSGNGSREDKLLQICALLESNVAHYNWVGFYFANHESQTLHLGPYVGAPTDHTVIPFGKGICGQVAVSNNNFIVPDVAAQDNYIACSFVPEVLLDIPLVQLAGFSSGCIFHSSHRRNILENEQDITQAHVQMN